MKKSSVYMVVAILLLSSAMLLFIDKDWDDDDEEVPYIVHMEGEDSSFESMAFVLNSVMEQLNVYYFTFMGSVTIDNQKYSGIAFTDFSSIYEDESDVIYVGSGFIPLWNHGFPKIIESPTIVPDAGEMENYEFLFTTICEPFLRHCVVDDEYVVFGVNDSGQMCLDTYSLFNDSMKLEDYIFDNVVDVTLGSLYSYDENKWLDSDDYGQYNPLTGISLSEALNYDEIKQYIDDIVHNQDQNLEEIIETTWTRYGQEALNAFILNYQSETFLGYDVDEIVKIASDLDYNQYLRFSPDGFTIDEIAESIDSVANWFMGALNYLLMAVSVALTFLVPGGVIASSVVGALTGGIMDVLFQLVNTGTVDVGKALFSALVGGIAGRISTLKPGLMNYVGSALFDGVSEGLTTLIDGGNINDALASFGKGCIAGLFISGVCHTYGKHVDSKQHANESHGMNISTRPSSASHQGMELVTDSRQLPSMTPDQISRINSANHVQVGYGKTSSEYNVDITFGSQPTKTFTGNHTYVTDGSVEVHTYRNNDGYVDVEIQNNNRKVYIHQLGYYDDFVKTIGFENHGKTTHISVFSDNHYHIHMMDGSSVMSAGGQSDYRELVGGPYRLQLDSDSGPTWYGKYHHRNVGGNGYEADYYYKLTYNSKTNDWDSKRIKIGDNLDPLIQKIDEAIGESYPEPGIQKKEMETMFEEFESKWRNSTGINANGAIISNHMGDTEVEGLDIASKLYSIVSIYNRDSKVICIC